MTSTVALADKKAPARLVTSVVILRLFVEVALGSFTKAVYKLQPNPAINLVFTNSVMFILCVLFHLINKAFPLIPQAFGGSGWSKPNKAAIKGLILPTICLCGSIFLKQNIIKNSGPGYAEMIAGIGVPMSALIQYFVNGVTIGKIGIASCIVAFLCYATCLPVCGPLELIGGAGAAGLNVTRASFSKKANKSAKLPPGLNLIYTCLLGLPFYVVLAIIGEYYIYSPTPEYNWRNLFVFYGPIPFFETSFALQMFFAFCSNIIVFVIYDIASPLTYVISASFKGLTQTFFDIFYIDYYVACVAKWFIPSIDAEKYKNKKEMTTYAQIAFAMKCVYVGLYTGEKVYVKRKEKKAAKTAQVESN